MAKFGGEALLDNQSSETQTLSGPVQTVCSHGVQKPVCKNFLHTGIVVGVSHLHTGLLHAAFLCLISVCKIAVSVQILNLAVGRCCGVILAVADVL